MRAPDATSQLMKLRKTKFIGTIDHNRIGTRNVDASLDDCRAEQDVELLMIEVSHYFLELSLCHLPVGDRDPRLWNDFLQVCSGAFNRLHFIVEVEHLSAAQKFARYSFLY